MISFPALPGAFAPITRVPPPSWANSREVAVTMLDPPAVFHQSDKRDSNSFRLSRNEFSAPSIRNEDMARDNDREQPFPCETPSLSPETYLRSQLANGQPNQ